MNRVVIVGSGGAGKSVLARALAAKTGLPLIHLDKEHWRPGWVETPKSEWTEKVRSMVAADRWVMDGNYGGTMDMRLERADTIVFLDFPRWRCVWGIFRRWFRYRGRTREDMAEGIVERFPEWSFVKWIWEYPARSRPTVMERLARYGLGRRVVTLRSPRDVAAFLAPIGSRRRACGAVIRDGNVLMVRHRHDGREYWTLPGGGVEKDESFEQAAVREMAEETGLVTRAVRQLWEGTYEDGPSAERCFLLEEVVAGQDARLGTDPEESDKSPELQMLKETRWMMLDEMKDDSQIAKVRRALGLG